jgi:hypothetical protein
MATWSIRIDDDDDLSFADEPDLPAEVVSISEALNGDELAVIRLPNNATYTTMIESDHDVQVQFGGTTIFYGRLTGATYSQDYLDVVIHNVVWEKALRTLFGDPATSEGDYSSGATDTTILADICTKGGWTAGTTSGVTRSMKFDKSLCFDAIWYLSQSTNKDFWTGDVNARGTNPRTINLGSRGTNRGAITTIGLSKNSVDRAKKRDTVTVIGYDNAGARMSVTDGAGNYQVAYRERKASSSTTLTDIAAMRKTKLNKDTSGSTVVVPISTGYNIYPGDTVTVDFSSIKFPSGSYRVIKTTKMMATVELELDRAFPTTGEALKSLSSLEDIGVYSGGSEQIPLGEQKWASDILFYAGVAGVNLHNSFEWHDGAAGNPDVVFSDGTSKAISAGNATGLAASTTYWYYIDLADSAPLTLKQATTLGDLDEPAHIPIVKVKTPTNNTENIEIFPEVGCISKTTIGTSTFGAGVIVCPDFRTAWNVGAAGGGAGTRLSSAGLYGYSGGTTKSFYLESSDGKAYAGAGAVILDGNGITISGNPGGGGGWLTFKDSNGDTVMYATTTHGPPDLFKIEATNGNNLSLGVWTGGGMTYYDIFLQGSDRTLTNDFHILPSAAGTLDLGDSTLVWRHLYINEPILTVHGSVPETEEGRLLYKRTGAGSKGYLYCCMKNSSDALEWVQVGITT